MFYLDALRPLPKNPQNVNLWKILRLEMWIIVTHTWDNYCLPNIENCMSWLAVTYMNENMQLSSKQ